MHPEMALAELEQVGEYTAVATNYILTPAVKGTLIVHDHNNNIAHDTSPYFYRTLLSDYF